MIDDTDNLVLDSSVRHHLPAIQVMSDGEQWYLIQPGDFEATVGSENLIGHWDMDSVDG